MRDEPGFRRRLWEALNPGREWSESVSDSEDHLVHQVVEKMDHLKHVYGRLEKEEERVRKYEGELDDIKVKLWGYEGAPERPMGVKNHHITSEIRRLQAASLNSKKKASQKWADELLAALNHAGELEEEIQEYEVNLRKLCGELGVEQPKINRDGGPEEDDLLVGERWVRRELLTRLGMWMRGLLSRIEYAEVGQQLWVEMFAQLRDTAINYAPVVAHCQPVEHIFELCRSSDRFKLEVERRVHRPSEAIEIGRSLKHLYTTDEAERERQQRGDEETG